MTDRWTCVRNRTIKMSTWLGEKRQSGDPNLLGNIGNGNLEIKEVAQIKVSRADSELVIRLEKLGFSPRFRYFERNVLFESWLTPDGTTEISLLLNKDHQESLASAPMIQFPFETWFEDRVILVAANEEEFSASQNVFVTEIGSTDAQTFENHRQAVEERLKLHKVLRLEDVEDMRAQSFYFVRSTLGGTSDIYYNP